MSKAGKFCISIDYELLWGVRDSLGLDYSPNILSTHTSIPKILELFKLYNIHATWATVAFILLDNDKISKVLSEIECLPQYDDCHQNDNVDLNVILNTNPKLYYANDMVKLINSYKNQDVGSHTASHLYYLDAVNSIESFDADLKISNDIFLSHDIKVNSFVFPRNQYNDSSISKLSSIDIRSFRSNPSHWAYKSIGTKNNRLYMKAFRFLDSYVNLSGSNSYKLNSLEEVHNCLSIPASMILRPINSFNLLNILHLNRIKAAMTHSAKTGSVFHLWWHPHNFGNNIEANLEMLTSILEHFHFLKREYSFSSESMYDLYVSYKGV